MYIAIVTFNENEAASIDELFDYLDASGFRRLGEKGIGARFKDGTQLRLQHTPLYSQGNVVAATALASLFSDTDTEKVDYFIFYGCAGAAESHNLNEVFLVGEASYVSLGTVESAQNGGEHVTIKNKWLCKIVNDKTEPLESVSFPEVRGYLNGGITAKKESIAKLTGFRAAHVAATDKVIKIPLPATAPTPVITGTRHKYNKDNWPYGYALKYIQGSTHLPLLVEMESYGIGKLAHALGLSEKVIVVRVTTDCLSDHYDSDDNQKKFLLKYNKSVWRIIELIVDRARGVNHEF